MNRTQRAIKKSLRLAMNSKKREKRFAIAEMKDSYMDNASNKAVRDLLKEEKDLREWHRKCLNDYSSQNKSKEVLTI